MIKEGQIYKDDEGIFTITSYYDDSTYMGEGNYFFDLIYANGKTECWQDAENIEDCELIAEYPTWQEAVNSREFNNIDCEKDGYKTAREIELEKKLEIAVKALKK